MKADRFTADKITQINLMTPTHVVTGRLEKTSFTKTSGTKFSGLECADFRCEHIGQFESENAMRVTLLKHPCVCRGRSLAHICNKCIKRGALIH